MYLNEALGKCSEIEVMVSASAKKQKKTKHTSGRHKPLSHSIVCKKKKKKVLFVLQEQQEFSLAVPLSVM